MQCNAYFTTHSVTHSLQPLLSLLYLYTIARQQNTETPLYSENFSGYGEATQDPSFTSLFYSPTHPSPYPGAPVLARTYRETEISSMMATVAKQTRREKHKSRANNVAEKMKTGVRKVKHVVRMGGRLVCFVALSPFIRLIFMYKLSKF